MAVYKKEWAPVAVLQWWRWCMRAIDGSEGKGHCYFFLSLCCEPTIACFFFFYDWVSFLQYFNTHPITSAPFPPRMTHIPSYTYPWQTPFFSLLSSFCLSFLLGSMYYRTLSLSYWFLLYPNCSLPQDILVAGFQSLASPWPLVFEALGSK